MLVAPTSAPPPERTRVVRCAFARNLLSPGPEDTHGQQEERDDEERLEAVEARLEEPASPCARLELSASLQTSRERYRMCGGSGRSATGRTDHQRISSPFQSSEADLDINAGLVDQQLTAAIARVRPQLLLALGNQAKGDDHKVRSACFGMLCLQHMLGIDESDALDSITEGGDDAGVDAVHIGDVIDGEFTTTLLQSKYSKSLDGKAGYPANSIVRVISTIKRMFDPKSPLQVNPRLEERLEEVRSLISDGNIPEVRVLLCNNGRTWEANGQGEIDASALPADRVTFIHVNHERLVELMQRRKSISAQLRLAGKAIVENFDFRRVLIGKLPVSEIKGLFDAYSDALLDRNIRRYLGLRGNRVNVGIHDTLAEPARRSDFYFFNNGITAICTKFSHNALQAEDWVLSTEGLQIVNGGQTSKTIQLALRERPDNDFSKTFVLLRLYEISSQDEIINKITFATNSQNPVDLTDLHSNDPVQERLALGLRDVGFEYKRKRDDQVSATADVITSAVAAEAVMAAWLRKPHAAKFRRSRLFSDNYAEIFSSGLQVAHVVLSVLAFRLVENERKRPTRSRPRFVPYASHFLAMTVIDLLLEQNSISRERITHKELPGLRADFEDPKKRRQMYEIAVKRVTKALRRLGIKNDTPLPRIAAQFRRGDLLEPLQAALSAEHVS